MMKRSLLRDMLCGLLLGLMILPAQPAQAQWTVFDPAAYSQRIRAELRHIQEWLNEIQRYQQMYLNAVQQLTTLRGVLQTADKELAKTLALARLTNDIGEIIRGSYLLQNKVRNIVRYQVAALQQIDDRLRNGIFDPDKDLADLEEYLVYSMGRNSRQTIQLAVSTAAADAQLNKWVTEKQDADRRLAEAKKVEAEIKARLEREKNNPDTLVIQPLIDALQKNQQLIESILKQITDLEEKIQQRLNLYGVRLSDMENFGYVIESTKMAWPELNKTKDGIAKTFDAAILQMRPEQ